MRDDRCEVYSTVRVDMRERIIAETVSSPEYMAAVASKVADLRADGDGEDADELEEMLAEARRRIRAKNSDAVAGGRIAEAGAGQLSA